MHRIPASGRNIQLNWNEPDDDKNKWPPKNKPRNDAPPDLDEILSKIRDFVTKLFGDGNDSGRSGRGGGRGGRRGGQSFKVPSYYFAIAAVILVIVLIYNTTHFIDQQERGVVLRFGEHVRTMNPGLNFRFPTPIERLYRVNVGQVRSVSHKATMLTQDENIVDVEVAVQWRINDPEAYLFNVVNPERTLKQVTESVVREVIGKSQLDFIFTEGRNEIASNQQELIQETLIDYAAGILVLGVEMQPAKPPEQVKAAFDDAIKAREDEQRLVNEAEAYRSDIIPKARGGAARMREEANAYKEQTIARAEGEASRFEQLLTEYERAPAVTRQRLYLETLEEVMSNSNKILMDGGDSGNSLMYLPLDKIIESRSNNEARDNRRRTQDDMGLLNNTGNNSVPIQDTNSRFRGQR